MFCFNEFAFTVQVKHKINSTQILGLILICLYFTTGHFHTCILCKECSRYLPFLILGSVFSDCVVFYGDIYYLNSKCVCVYCLNRKKPAWQEKDIATSLGTLIVFIVVFLLLQFCTYRQLLELKLLALPFCPAHCIFYCSFLHTVQINDDDEIRHSELSSNDNNKRDHSNGSE